ncbi:hypothetical protein Dimus_017132 [Dionaea muscipula]
MRPSSTPLNSPYAFNSRVPISPIFPQFPSSLFGSSPFSVLPHSLPLFFVIPFFSVEIHLHQGDKMTRSRSGSNSTTGPISHCRNCGRTRKEYTAWTDENPGRRFLQCLTRSCNHFTWIDDPICERCKQGFQRLLRRIKSLEDELSLASQRHHSGTMSTGDINAVELVPNVGASSAQLHLLHHPILTSQFHSSLLFMVATWGRVALMLLIFTFLKMY